MIDSEEPFVAFHFDLSVEGNFDSVTQLYMAVVPIGTASQLNYELSAPSYPHPYCRMFVPDIVTAG
eukprot:scaffold1809_cov386-Prasinococcus_capsulatus_cf.AAC.52